ncbi:MAG TPA: two-component regulator propeller domain-containing protein [Bacteroidia bacterium]|nr:two-component regulator propeller domain-containing protein [Bacteroidia bacterium]
MFVFLAATVNSQDIAIGQWREHLPYNDAIAVTQGEGKIYCATPSGIFSYSLIDNSYTRLSKVTGLSDIGATCIKFNNYNNTLVIGYSDGNVDLVENNTVINISDIKNKDITSSKTINSIYFINQYAYLACGFGIVVLNTQQQTVADTYHIGPNGTYINVRDITSDGTNIYAATDGGIYEAPLNSPNLADYNNWTKTGGATLPAGIYNTITFINGKVFANFSNKLTHNTWMKDTVYESANNGITWSVFSGALGTNIYKIESSNNHLLICTQYSVNNYDNNANLLGNLQYNLSPNGMSDVDAVVDQNNSVWIADQNVGLVKYINPSSSQLYVPNGPKTANVFAMAIGNNTLWAVPGGVDGSWNNLYNTDGVFLFDNDSWSTINPCNCGTNTDTLFDEFAVAVDPNDPTHAYVGSWGKGLLEFYKGSVVNLFTDQNTNGALQGLGLSGYNPIRIGGLAFDQNGYIWASNSGVAHTLCYRPPDGTWHGLNFSAFINPSSEIIGNVMITQSGEKWVILARSTGGILVYQDNGTFAQPNSGNTKILNGVTGNGGLVSTNIFSMAQDKTGAVWVGTDQGIEVFYSPDAIFSGSGNWDAQQILLVQNGLVQILLQTQSVTAIVVDGANRKWLGTYGGGVFLMSADGTQQIQHFTAENSPLLSDNVTSIAINPNTGEVFFGTDKGIISYKSTATEGGTDFGNVYAYPNPVPHGYSGPIAIKGLVKDADVRITDITGKLVYKTTALGGQAIWQGTNFDGRRVQSGVYLVFCSNSDGSKTFVTKILFMN